jgi:hypothetical protein
MTNFNKNEERIILEAVGMYLTNPDDFLELVEYLEIREEELDALRDKVLDELRK